MNKEILTLTKGWHFHLGDIDGAWFKGFDDSAWRRVLVPHDWSVEGPFSKEYSSGTGYLQGGIGWYRIRFSLPEDYRGKCVRVIFDGIYKNSQVWCNSYYLGNRPSGYSEIAYDITHAVNFGLTDNVIAVKVTHTDIADSRWFTGSGIYRKVTLEIEENVHPVLHGIRFTSDNVSRASAEITVRQEIVNTSAEEKKVLIRTELPNRITKEAFTLEGEAVIPAGETAKVALHGTMKNPRLWSVDDPALYEMSTFYTVDGEEYLADQEKVGIRKAVFDPEKGFFLNDEPLKFKGVCLHHDAGVLGAAVTKEVWQRRLAIFKKMGCNAIRCAHNPHMPELYELCDAMGFMMMDEAFDEWEAAKNKWSTGHNVYPPKHQGYFEAFPVWHDTDLRSMVRRGRNHPSIMLWSIGNEIDYPNDPYCHPKFKTMTGNNDKDKPAAEREYNPDKPNMERLAVLSKELCNIVREEDDSRPVTLASAFPELSSYLGFLDPLDVIGYNYKEQFYEEDHKRFPGKAFIGSENGGRPEAWKIVEDNDYVCGQFLWVGADFLGEAHGWPIHCSQAGYVLTNGLPKDRYYERAKLWGASPERPVVSDLEAVNVKIELWQEPDAVTHESFDRVSNEDGYIYQFIVSLTDAEGGETSEDHLFRVQVEGAGELMGVDTGDVADLTPIRENYKKTMNGKAVVFVKRNGKGDIHLCLNCIDEQKGMLKGRDFEILVDR